MQNSVAIDDIIHLPALNRPTICFDIRIWSFSVLTPITASFMSLLLNSTHTNYVIFLLANS